METFVLAPLEAARHRRVGGFLPNDLD